MASSDREIGKTRWAIADGYIPEWSHGPEPQMESHESLAFLNATDRPAHIELEIFFSDRDPAGPYRVEIPARRTKHVRLNELEDPAPLPRGTDFACLVKSDVPVVVQHTRLDSRQPANALVTTIAWSSD